MHELRKTCRHCEGKLEIVTNLGEIYPSGFAQLGVPSGEKYPLGMSKCVDCGLVQLFSDVPLDNMYRQYWYRSALNKSMISDLGDVVYSVLNKISLKSFDTVVDIGSNDGTLLDMYSYYPNLRNLVRIGFDPAKNVYDALSNRMDAFVNDYFSAEEYFKITDKKAKIITAIAMFYDLPSPEKFVKDVYEILDDDGIFVVQFTDLYSMLKINAFDNICNEHLEYYTLEWLTTFFANLNMVIFDAEYNEVNGGSLRIFVSKIGRRFPGAKFIFHSMKEKLYFATADRFKIFNQNIVDFSLLVKKYLKDNFVLGMGASTKGNTLLQVWNIDARDIRCIGEVNRDKFGLYTVGSRIPIISEEEALELKPDAFMILPWHFESTFVSNFGNYLRNGGKLLFPLPEPHVIYFENGEVKCKLLKNQ